MRLLVAEDDPRLLKTLVHIFTKNGYTVDGVENGDDAYDYAVSGEYDGLVLDIMMPGRDGISVLSRLRAEGDHTPALFLTARAEVSQRVEGLDAGADDYLAKPFSTEELLARVRAMLRRRENFSPELLTFAGAVLNVSTFVFSYHGRGETLGGKEFRILEALMRDPGVIVSTDKLILSVWGFDTEVETGVVWVHVSNLRKKIEATGAPLAIRFVRGAGYVLEASTEQGGKK